MIFLPYHYVPEALIRSSENPSCSCGIAAGHGWIVKTHVRCAVLPMYVTLVSMGREKVKYFATFDLKEPSYDPDANSHLHVLCRWDNRLE